MTGPSSTPRGERAGTPGIRAVTELRMVEVVVEDDGDNPFAWRELPTPNRATRRAQNRAARRTK